MNNITKADRAKIISLYFDYPAGCQIVAVDPHGDTPEDKVTGWLTGFHGEYGVGFAKIEEGGHTAEEPSYQDYDKVQLILKKLESITDEHMIEIARIIGGLPIEDVIVVRNDKNVMLFAREDDNGEHSKDGRLVVNHANHEIYWWSCDSICEPDFYRSAEIVDFIRSNGYCLDYKGINLFEAGLAITPKDKQ